MGIVEIAGLVLSNLPIVELVTSGVQTNSTPGFLYDIAQAMLGLKLVATGADKMARATPWTWDDGPTKALLGYTTKATAWVTGLTSTPKGKAK